METISALIRGDLPPVGNPIAYSSKNKRVSLPEFNNYNCCWVDSGTAALALAFLSVKSLCAEVAFPEVILPGYCCPDLVAAAHYAGLHPVIVDIEIDDPALNQDILKQVISKNTVAIVAINFLGVFENIQSLLYLKSECPHLFIIEDNAQWFPSKEEQHLLSGDFVTFSFGRGKPVSLLGGGLLLSKVELAADVLANISSPQEYGSLSLLSLNAKYFTFNRLMKPFFYQFLNRNPFVSLGQTCYHALNEITPLDSVRSALLSANIERYEGSNTGVDSRYDQLFSVLGFQNAFRSLASARRHRLLRYPVLFASIEQKNRVFPRLVRLGLGATEMYKVPLPDIDGVENIASVGDLKNAKSFATRFISLPVHAGVSEKHLQLIRDAFCEK